MSGTLCLLGLKMAHIPQLYWRMDSLFQFRKLKYFRRWAEEMVTCHEKNSVL